MLQVGDIEIHLISDGTVYVDAGGPFGLVPRVLWSRHFMPPVGENLIPMTLTCLLVRSGGKNIVVDTGYGTKLGDKVERFLGLERPHGGLLDGLSRLGLSPGDIDLVIDTHLHGDHAGGNTYQAADSSEIKPTFPNAEYVVQQREYDDAMVPNERTRATYILDNYVPLVESGQMRLLNGDEELLPGVRGVVTPGHTPGHMSVVFESNGETAAFVCDLASYAVHFERLGWMSAYDVEPLVTLETKREWQQWALANNVLLIFPHDPKRHAGYLRENDGKMQLEPVDAGYV